MCIDKINFDEASFFYKSPHSLVDYSMVQSYTLIKSVIELFAYYGITDFTAEDIKEFFVRLELVQQKNNKVFIPSRKKIDSVLELCIDGRDNSLSYHNDTYHIDRWDTSGYAYELSAAKNKGLL